MSITTYTWTAASGTTNDWTTPSDWAIVGGSSQPGANNFLANQQGPATGFEVETNASIGLLNVGGGGQEVHDFTFDDANGSATFSSGAFNVGTLTLFSGQFVATQDSGRTVIGNSYLVDGTLQVGGSDAFDGYSIQGVNGSQTISGDGTILASGGLAFFSNNIVTDVSNYEIANNGANTAELDFTGNVTGGAVTFDGGSGLLIVAGSQIGNGTDLSNGSFGATIGGLTAGSGFTNGIDINDGSTVVSATLSGSGNDTLTVFDNAGSTVTFDLTGNYLGDTAVVKSDTSFGGFDVFIMVCFAAGTAVLAKHGEIAVETIRPGDQVMTLVDGAYVPRTVKWVGQRDIDLTRHPKREEAAPVRIARGALGDNLPRRDLLLSGDHCLFIDGRLYPAKLLINDMTITRELTAKSVSYYHVELEQHAVMVVEGVAAESYLDTGNRAFFSNAGVAMLLHPEFTINETLRCWETDACAPLTVRPELVKPVWQRFVDRAVALGHAPTVHATTDDAAIHLLVDGAVVRPLVSTGGKVSFMLPATAKSIRLVSRATRQSTLMPWLDDPRTLGVAIRSVTLRDQAGESVIGADHPGLRDGWHAAERGADGALWRWSAGNAALPIRIAKPCMLEIALSDTATYIADARRLAA
jgi:hypothetical protein